MKLLLLGPQGCGKGTVGALLSKKLNIPAVSTGDLLRRLTPDSAYYAPVNDAMLQGLLAPNDMVAAILREELDKDIYKNGFILDGWGRQLSDLEQFDPVFDKVLVLSIARETSIKRISGRRLCDSDGKTYNIYTLPKEELAKCTGTLTQRADDNEEDVAQRLAIYYSTTQKVIDYFSSKGNLLTIDAEGTPEEVLANALVALGITL